MATVTAQVILMSHVMFYNASPKAANQRDLRLLHTSRSRQPTQSHRLHFGASPSHCGSSSSLAAPANASDASSPSGSGKSVCPTETCRDTPPNEKPDKLKAAAQVLSLMGVSLLLHQLPPRVPKDGLKTMLPSDWKVWARVILGIAAVQKINQTLDWKPKPWLGALEAIAIINPLAVGFSRNNFRQMLVMAPIVAGVVQATSALQKNLTQPAEDKANIPPVITRLALSLAFGLASFLAYSAIYRRIASTGIIGKELKEKAIEGGSAFASATFATCARGCSPGSFICLGEMADIVGSLGNLEEPDVSDEVEKEADKGDPGKSKPANAPASKGNALTQPPKSPTSSSLPTASTSHPPSPSFKAHPSSPANVPMPRPTKAKPIVKAPDTRQPQSLQKDRTGGAQ